MRNRPFIGVSGFVTERDVSHITQRARLPHGRRLAIAILANERLLRKRNLWEPIKDMAVFSRSARKTPARAYNPLHLIHYSTRHNDETMLAQIKRVTAYGGDFVNGLQLDMGWPRPCVLEAYADEFPHMEIILQIGRHALSRVSHPRVLARKMREYEACVHHVLFDEKNNKEEMDGRMSREYIEALINEGIHSFAHLGLSVDVKSKSTVRDSLDEVRSLLEDFPALSVHFDESFGKADAKAFDKEHAVCVINMLGEITATPEYHTWHNYKKRGEE